MSHSVHLNPLIKLKRCLVSHLRKPEPTKIPAILSRATPVLTMFGSWTTPNSTTVSNSPEGRGKNILTNTTKNNKKWEHDMKKISA